MLNETLSVIFKHRAPVWNCSNFSFLIGFSADEALIELNKCNAHSFSNSKARQVSCLKTCTVQMHSVWKTTEKVSFYNIASGASYVYILNVQKLLKNAKYCPIWQVFENLHLAVKQRYQTDHF